MRGWPFVTSIAFEAWLLVRGGRRSNEGAPPEEPKVHRGDVGNLLSKKKSSQVASLQL